MTRNRNKPVLGRKPIRSRLRRPKINRRKFGGDTDDSSDEGSFVRILIRVSLSLSLGCSLFYSILLIRSTELNSATAKHTSDLGFITESGAQHMSVAEDDMFNKRKHKYLASEDIWHDEAFRDCFDIANSLPSFQQNFQGFAQNVNSTLLLKFIRKTKSLRAEFSARYGGDAKARAMLARGLSTFHEEANAASEKTNQRANDSLYISVLPVDVIHTANRILKARFENRTLKIAFGGYSVTVGRGNYFHQSYPFVMERILKEPMKMIGVDLSVRNAAIGGVPSFPYGFCLENFLGDDADIISWDYSMNEPGDVSAGLEAYLRQTLTMKKGPPLLIVKDTHMATRRKSVIHEYVNNGLLKDPIIVHTDPAAEPFLREDESARPPGFQKWRVFGAPKGASGQARHHPSVKEHELIGWILAMHFLGAMEIAADIVARGIDIEQHILKSHGPLKVMLPPPINIPDPSSPGSSLLFGQPTNGNSTSSTWSSNHISCRTTFDPILDGSLDSIITSGVMNDLDPMLPKSEMIFKEGWVLDYGEGERRAKRKLKPYDGLGYIDSKKAYYGLPMSKTLKMMLPWEGFKTRAQLTSSTDASNWFKSLVLCEVNEERGDTECKLDTNIQIVAGGKIVENVTYIDAVGVSYLSKKICVDVSIPSTAQITKSPSDGSVYLSVDINAKAPTRSKDGPCSISHVVWEEVSQ